MSDAVTSPLLMIPGPVEVSPRVRQALTAAPPSHTAPALLEAFGRSLEAMRAVWRAPDDAQPFVVAGGGTVAMDMAAANLVEPGDTAVVVVTGYFGDRMAEMLRRQGAKVHTVTAPVGEAPTLDAIGNAMERAGGGAGAVQVVCATHVDTSTGVLLPPSTLEALCARATEAGALSIVDGVCATAGETFRMADWGADVYLTGSQKALGVPPGLALSVVSRRALETRRGRRATAPALYLDWEAWLPIHEAYEARRPSYFSTPATGLILALDAALREITEEGVETRVERHARAARALRAAWSALGLAPVARSEAITAHTLSALYLPDGVEGLPGRVAEHGVAVAGGLHPEIKTRSFRVGHMGWVTGQPLLLETTVRAVADGLADAGYGQADAAAAVAAFRAAYGPEAAS